MRVFKYLILLFFIMLFIKFFFFYELSRSNDSVSEIYHLLFYNWRKECFIIFGMLSSNSLMVCSIVSTTVSSWSVSTLKLAQVSFCFLSPCFMLLNWNKLQSHNNLAYGDIEEAMHLALYSWLGHILSSVDFHSQICYLLPTNNLQDKTDLLKKKKKKRDFHSKERYHLVLGTTTPLV